jgi:hypothetical protein
MPRTSPAYAITRRRGKLGTIHRQIATSTNDDLLTRSDTFSADVVRYMYQGETRYNRLLRANAAQQRVGDVTFVVCLTDVTFTSVQAEDRIDYQGTLYEVTSSQILDDGLIIEARVFDGS